MTVTAPVQRTSSDSATGEFALRCPYEDRDAVHQAVEQVRQAEQAVAALKDDRGQKPIVPMPLREGVKPYWHQITAFNIVMTLFGCESNGLDISNRPTLADLQKEVVPNGARRG